MKNKSLTAFAAFTLLPAFLLTVGVCGLMGQVGANGLDAIDAGQFWGGLCIATAGVIGYMLATFGFIAFCRWTVR